MDFDLPTTFRKVGGNLLAASLGVGLGVSPPGWHGPKNARFPWLPGKMATRNPKQPTTERMLTKTLGNIAIHHKLPFPSTGDLRQHFGVAIQQYVRWFCDRSPGGQVKEQARAEGSEM